MDPDDRVLDEPTGHGPPEVERDGVGPLPMPPAHHEVEPDRIGAGESDGEAVRRPDRRPLRARERLHEMGDRLREAAVGRLGERQPTARAYLPVVHAPEAHPRQSTEDLGGHRQEVLRVLDLALAEERRERGEKGDRFGSVALVLDVQLELNVSEPDASVRARRADRPAGHSTTGGRSARTDYLRGG